VVASAGSPAKARLGGLPEEIIDAYREDRTNADTATALKSRQLVDNNEFYRIYPFQLLVWLRAVQRGFEGLSEPSWNVEGVTSRICCAPKRLVRRPVVRNYLAYEA